MEDFLNDTLDLVQGVVEPDCDCSGYYFYGTCEHVRIRTCLRLCLSPPLLRPLTSLPPVLQVHKTLLLVDDTEDEASFEGKCVCTRMYVCMYASGSLSPPPNTHTHTHTNY
jgi:hypothetical protein